MDRIDRNRPMHACLKQPYKGLLLFLFEVDRALVPTVTYAEQDGAHAEIDYSNSDGVRLKFKATKRR